MRRKGYRRNRKGRKNINYLGIGFLCLFAALCVLSGSCVLTFTDGTPEAQDPVEITISPATEADVTPTPAPTPAPTEEPVAATDEAAASNAPEPTKTESPPESVDSSRSLDLPASSDDSTTQKYGSPYSENGVLSNEKLSWYFNINDKFLPPTAQTKFDIRSFDGYYLGDVSQKVLYLTFDEGYEYGCTAEILDILRDKNVTACFFVTGPYVKSNPDLIIRMLDEGHIVGSHSVNHKSMPDLNDEDFKSEISGLEDIYRDITGREIGKFFRPPMGEYSARTLELTRELGYKTIFWSFAYRDWETDNQPGAAKAFDMTVSHVHNGAIILLHAVSVSNTEALPDIIDCLRENGFEFVSLYDLPE